MRVLVTGSDGFVGRNLLVHLKEIRDLELITFTRNDLIESLSEKVKEADFIFHLAGVNRPKEESEFTVGNSDLTKNLCDAIRKTKRSIPVVYTSSIQAELNNSYGKSKKEAEGHLLSLEKETKNPIYIFRLPNVFGKWAKPNYNSAVATFCYNILNDLPVQIHDPNSVINLVYVDDVISTFLKVMNSGVFQNVDPVYQITVDNLKKQITAFKESKNTHVTERVGTGLTRALYSTYISYFKPDQFQYPLVKHEDPRGVFVEMLKTKDSGQFSFFTAHKGVTRGGHYHHTKTEKFLVIKGKARYCFRHMITDEKFEIISTGDEPVVVETIPGWTHDITNIGEEEMVVMLWANEIFDRENPDTYASKV
ncbi:MAG: UDP-2-acetamido-2,6-beta-L-arabino-hexul-4-ose reductase [Bacteriovoracaceae bacterium]